MTSTTHPTDADGEAAINQRMAVRDHALAALADTPTDGESVKSTVLRELHRQHPAITLEDILELSVSIVVPEVDTVSGCVDSVLNEAINQHDSWQTAESPSESARAGVPATEER